MRFEIFNTYDDSKTLLKLKQDDGDVILQVVDNNGRWITNLLTIKANGTLYKHSSVDDAVGFQLDSYGRIKDEY